MRRLFIILLIFLAKQPKGISQTPSHVNEILPKIMPATPEAASVAKFGNYNVNLFAGIPDITIPLYEIKSGNLSVPISISYHASGLKINDWGSWVGIGWSLNAGGSITRKVMGQADEKEGNYLSGQTVKIAGDIDTKTQGDLDYLRYIQQGIKDVEPDIFSYNIPGKSGKFLFNQKDNFAPITIPFDPIEVSLIRPNSSNVLFDIKDENGRTFKFEEPGTEVSQVYSGGNETTSTSAWMLTKMIDANQQDEISFTYSYRYGQVSYDYNDYIVVSDLIQDFESTKGECDEFNCCHVTEHQIYFSDIGVAYSSFQSIYASERKISEINFKNGKLVFEASLADRTDAFAGQKSLKAIKIYSVDPVLLTTTLLKTITFYQSYSSGSRLQLDKLTISDATNKVIETYNFTYNTEVQLPDKTSKARDYWGYYNYKSNTTLVPKITIPYQSTISSGVTTITIGSSVINSREPDPYYMKAGILKSITYPTGGRTEFEFDANKYKDALNVIKYAGGLRIKSIKSYDGINSDPLVKTYVYGENESDAGRANYQLSSYFFETKQDVRFIGGQYTPTDICAYAYVAIPHEKSKKRVRTFSSNPTIEIEPYDGSPVVYPVVTVYDGDLTNNTGRTIYTFTDHADGLGTTMITNRPIITSYHMDRGQLYTKTIEKKIDNNGSISYQTLSKTLNTYGAFSEQFYENLGLVVLKNLISDGENDQNIALGPDIGNGTVSDSYSYVFTNYSIRSHDNYLKQATEMIYDQNDISKIQTTVTDFSYANFKHQQVTKIVTTNSKEETITTFKKYPFDYTFTGTVTDATAKGIYKLQTTHLMTPVIEEYTQKKKLDGTNIGTIAATFTSYKQDQIFPEIIKKIDISTPITDFTPSNITATSSQIDSRYKSKAVYNQLDSYGHILQYQKSNNIYSSYIWDYKTSLPIAEAINAASNEIAYTSFEADGKGGWTYSGNTSTNSFCPTGKQCFDLKNNGSIALPVNTLISTKKYIVSYWTNSNNSLSITGTIQGSIKKGRTIKTWTYYEHKITLVTTTSVSGTGLIDELRLYPETSQMTTYAYNPLIGITSQCDVNNKITYYEYDKSGRLRVIRDQDNNVLKRICYAYSGQGGDDCIFYFNRAKSKLFITNVSCDAGFSGSEEMYTVQSSTYWSDISQADADKKATDDISANGQNYANQFGKCVPKVNIFSANFDQLPNCSVTFKRVIEPYTEYAFTLDYVAGSPGTIQLTNTNTAIPLGTYNVTVSITGGGTGGQSITIGPNKYLTKVTNNGVAQFNNIIVTPNSYHTIAIGNPN